MANMLLPVLTKFFETLCSLDNEANLSIFRIHLVDQIKAADQITVNINLDQSKDEKRARPTAIVTATTQEEQRTTSILIEETDSPLQVTNMPFRSGTHLIIDDPQWWDEGTHIPIGQIKCIPVVCEHATTFKGIENDREEFRVYICADDTLKFSRPMHREIKVAQFDPKAPFYLGGTSTWTFTEYTPDRVIRFANIPGIVLSLDEHVARKAILIQRESEDLSASEYYILVFRAR